MAKTFFKLKDRCSFVALPDEGLILDPENRTYYRVNETAAVILHALNVAGLAGGGISLENLLNILKIYYFGVDEDKANAFLKQMKEADLIDLTPKEAQIPADAAFLPWGVTEIKNFDPPSHEEYGRTHKIARIANLKGLAYPAVFVLPKPPKILNKF